MTTEKWVKGALLVGGLGLAALGQFYLVYRRSYLWDGVLFWASGLVLIGLSVHLWRRTVGIVKPQRVALTWWMSAVAAHPLRAGAAGAGVGLSLIAGLAARQRPPDAGHADLLVLWLAGIGTFSAASWTFDLFPRRLPGRLLTRAEVRRWLREHGRLVLALLLLLGAGLVVRGFDLEHVPANLGGDEGTQGAAARALVRAPMGNPFSTGWYSVPTMSFLAYGLAMQVFGVTVSGLRTLSVVIGTATMWTTFCLARELWGERVGWLSATVLSFAHYHVHFSRLGSNQVADGLVVTLSLWLLVRGMRTKEPWAFAAAGVVMGLGWYGYFGARLVGVLAGVYLGLQAHLRHRFLARHRVLLTLLVAGALVALMPLLLHYSAHPGEVLSRPNQVSIFASGWLAREQEITGRSAAGLLLEQSWKAVSAFNYTLDPTFWYRASMPLLDVVGGVFFVLGMVWTVARCRWPSNSLLLLWFWMALLLGWVMTENPPSSQRMLIVAPALAILVALGIDWMLRLAGALLGIEDAGKQAVTTALLMVMAGINLGYYFLVYTPTRVYGNPTAEMTTVLARELQEEGYRGPLYFHGPPAVYWDFGTLQFMVPEVAGIDVPVGGEPGDADVRDETRFVFHPARLGELEDVRERFPSGSETYVRSTADGELLYAEYVVRR